MSLRALEAFVATVDNGSVTRAAEHLGLTQPAATLAIKELESAIGQALIDRSTRPLSATRAGVELHKRGLHLLAEVDRMLVAVTAASGEAMPSLRLGVAGPMMGSTWIFELRSLVQELHVLGGLTADLQKALLDRKMDAAVLSDTPMWDQPRLERRQLLVEPFVLVLPRSSSEHWRNASFREVTERLDLIRYSGRTTIGRTVDLYLRRCSLDVPRRLEFETSSSVLALVEGGLGWTITTPLCIAESHIDVSAVAIKPLPAAPAPRTLHLLNFAGELPIADRVRDILANSLKDLLTRSILDRDEWLLQQISFDDQQSAAKAMTAVLKD